MRKEMDMKDRDAMDREFSRLTVFSDILANFPNWADDRRVKARLEELRAQGAKLHDGYVMEFLLAGLPAWKDLEDLYQVWPLKKEV